MNTDDLKNLLTESLSETYVIDKHLYDKKLCERSKVFRIGLILSRKIESNKSYSGYSVDCEYNKRGDYKKIISSKNPQSPDLMLHRRGDFSDENLLVVEFKVYSKKFYKKGFKNDIKKLQILTSKREYNYKLGAHVCLCPSGYIIKWYQSGKPEQGFFIYSITLKKELEESDPKLLDTKFIREYKRDKRTGQ